MHATIAARVPMHLARWGARAGPNSMFWGGGLVDLFARTHHAASLTRLPQSGHLWLGGLASRANGQRASPPSLPASCQRAQGLHDSDASTV